MLFPRTFSKYFRTLTWDIFLRVWFCWSRETLDSWPATVEEKGQFYKDSIGIFKVLQDFFFFFFSFILSIFGDEIVPTKSFQWIPILEANCDISKNKLVLRPCCPLGSCEKYWSRSPSFQKGWSWFLQWKLLKNDEECFLFHLRWWFHDPGLPGWNFNPSSRDRFYPTITCGN